METTTEGLNLREYNWPKVTGLDVAFPTADTDKALLAEAKRRGYYCGHKPGNKMFATLFYSGGKVNFKKDVPEEFKNSAWAYLRSFIGSFAPKHEEKDAVCGMLLDELCESVESKDRSAD